MRHAASLGERDFGSRYLDALVNLDGVAIEDLAIEMQGGFDSERALAGSCRANDRDYAGSAGILPASLGYVLLV